MHDNGERTAQMQARGVGQIHRTGDAIQTSGCRHIKAHNPAEVLRSQINKASALSECLRDVVWSNLYIRTYSKIRTYEACIRPMKTYGTEELEDINKTKSMLRVTEMKTLRIIVRKIRRDRVRHTDVREQYGIQDIVRWGRQLRGQWYYHVKRMDENRLQKIAHRAQDHPKDGEIVDNLPLGKRRRVSVRINRSTDLQEVEEKEEE